MTKYLYCAFNLLYFLCMFTLLLLSPLVSPVSLLSFLPFIPEGIREAEKWEAGYSRGRARTKHDNSAIFFWQRNCCRESTLWKWRKWYNFYIFRPSEKVLFVVESWLFDEKTYWRRNYDVSQRFNLVPRVLSLPPSLLRERCRQIF